MEKDKLHQSFQHYLQTQCSYWAPGQDEYLAGEIVFQWKAREHIRQTMCHQQADMLRIDAALAALLFEMKKKLCRLGRSGGWSAWLKQMDIPRSTADRLVLDHAEFFGLQHELPHRAETEPLEGRICQHAYRTSERFETMLRSEKSRLTFITVLADLFGLRVEFGEADSVRVTIPPASGEAEIDYRVPNVVQLQVDGKVTPVDYELSEEDVL